MKLVGMLDSPYVRRVAVSLQLLGLPFEHQSLSVFRTFDEMRRINPVVKVPTLVCDDGGILMDSSLILEYAEALAKPAGRSLRPTALPALQHDLHVTGLALAALEKAVQIVYEHALRPPEKRHAPWMDRVALQLASGFELLERAVAAHPPAATQDLLTQGDITAAVAWHFTQALLPGRVPAADHPALAAFSARAEAMPAFMRAPHGETQMAAA